MTDLVRINSETANKLRELSSIHGYTMSYIVSRLVQKLCNGEFSGSIHDIMKNNRDKELEYDQK